MLLAAVSDDDLRAVVSTLVEMAKAGDLAAIRELLDRVLGKPTAALDVAIAAQTEQEPSADQTRERLRALAARLGATATDAIE
jgi:hypothetical protein